MINFKLVVVGLTLSICASTGATAQNIEALRAPDGYVGRIALIDKLDEPALGYCLDVPGPSSNINLRIPAWVHSCHAGSAPDQIYRYNVDGLGRFRFIFEEGGYDLCLTAENAAANTRFSYQACTDSPQQSFDVTEIGQIQMRGTDLCVVALNMDEGGPADAIGGARIFFGSDYTRQIDLQPCGTRPDVMVRFAAFPDGEI